MGIIDRFTTIVKANINDLLDRAEDPAKTADQLVLDMTENIAEVRRQTASVMAQEKRARREVEEYSGVENLTPRLYLAWILLGAALFCGLFIGTRSLLESLFGN